MGVNPKVVLAPTFPPAVIRTVSNLLSVPFSSVFNVKVSSKRRMLLTGYTMEYTLNITDSVYPSKMYIKLLEDSVTTGTFLTSLKNNSGMTVGEVSTFTYIDKSPTLSPTLSPVSIVSQSGEPRLAGRCLHIDVFYFVLISCIILKSVAAEPS